MVPVCSQMGRCGHWLPGSDSTSFTLSQVSRHVCPSIVSRQQLPLQGARLWLKGTSQAVVPGCRPRLFENQTSNFCLWSILVSAVLPVVWARVSLSTPKLQSILHGESFTRIPFFLCFISFLFVKEICAAPVTVS